MRFLIDEDLPRSAGDLLHRFGHKAKENLCLLTGDFDFSDIRNYPPSQYAGIVIVNPDPQKATAQAILKLLESFLIQKDLLTKLSGKLAIVRPEHIRLRGDQ